MKFFLKCLLFGTMAVCAYVLACAGVVAGDQIANPFGALAGLFLCWSMAVSLTLFLIAQLFH